MEHRRSEDSTDELNHHRQDQADQPQTDNTRQGLTDAVAHAAPHNRGDHKGDAGGQGSGADGSDSGNRTRESHQTTEGETGDQAVNGQEWQCRGVVALQCDVLRHKEQDQVADHRHPEQGHEHRRRHHRQTTDHPNRSENHAATDVGQGFVDHIGSNQGAGLRVADGLLEVAACWHVDQTTITSNILPALTRVWGSDLPIDAQVVTTAGRRGGHRPPPPAAQADVAPHRLTSTDIRQHPQRHPAHRKLPPDHSEHPGEDQPG